MRLSALLLTALLLVRADSDPQRRVEIPDVALAVTLPPSFELQTALTDGRPDYPAEFGYAYLIDMDISDSTAYRFDDVLIHRHDYFSSEQIESWLRGEDRTANGPQITWLGEVVPPPPGLPFERYRLFRYRQTRGPEAFQTSLGYHLFATDGTTAWDVRVGGLAESYEAGRPLYEAIIASVDRLN